jgi:hypothetical protein
MNTRNLILALLFALTGLYSCKNNDEVFPVTGVAFFNVVNASTDTLNFYINGTRQNNASSLYPGGQSFYLPVSDGKQNYQFKKAGGFNVLFSVPLNLSDSSNTSLYIYGEAAGQAFTTNDVLLRDTSHLDTTQIRFVNVSPDAGSLNVTVGDTLSFMSQAFKSSTAFKEIGGGQKEVKVTRAGVVTPLKDTLIVFQPGYIYTVFSQGLLNGKGNAAFGVGVVINATSTN